MKLFEVIRRERSEEEVSIRVLARRHRVHRRTVRQALAAVLPLPRRVVTGAARATDPHRATIRRWFAASSRRRPTGANRPAPASQALA